jgi:uncharacterized membrane protein
MNEPQHRYLAQLDRALGSLPAEQRRTIVDDVESHILDALEGGRDIGEILRGLGSPRDAARAYSAELGSYANETGAPQPADPVRRSQHRLAIAALVVGVLSAAFVPIISGSLLDTLGIGSAVLVFALPVILGALPLILPQNWGGVMAWVSAVATTGLVIFGLVPASDVGGDLIMLTALAAVLWALALAPRAAKSRGAGRLALRIFGGLLIATPGLSLFGPAVDVTVTSAVIGLAAVALGVLFACGWRIAYTAVLAGGVALLIGSLFDLGLLTWGFWTVGGVWIALGVAALAGRRPA